MLVVMQVKREYTLGQRRGLLAVGIWWLGQWQWGSVSRELVEGVTPGIITIAKYYFSENKTIEPGLILESRVNW